MNILQEEFLAEKFLQYALFAIILWFITVTIHILNKILEKSILVDKSVQIAVMHKKTAVFGKI
jgi:hypothetical protein